MVDENLAVLAEGLLNLLFKSKENVQSQRLPLRLSLTYEICILSQILGVNTYRHCQERLQAKSFFEVDFEVRAVQDILSVESLITIDPDILQQQTLKIGLSSSFALSIALNPLLTFGNALSSDPEWITPKVSSPISLSSKSVYVNHDYFFPQSGISNSENAVSSMLQQALIPHKKKKSAKTKRLSKYDLTNIRSSSDIFEYTLVPQTVKLGLEKTEPAEHHPSLLSIHYEPLSTNTSAKNQDVLVSEGTSVTIPEVEQMTSPINFLDVETSEGSSANIPLTSSSPNEIQPLHIEPVPADTDSLEKKEQKSEITDLSQGSLNIVSVKIFNRSDESVEIYSYTDGSIGIPVNTIGKLLGHESSYDSDKKIYRALTTPNQDVINIDLSTKQIKVNGKVILNNSHPLIEVKGISYAQDLIIDQAVFETIFDVKTVYDQKNLVLTINPLSGNIKAQTRKATKKEENNIDLKESRQFLERLSIQQRNMGIYSTIPPGRGAIARDFRYLSQGNATTSFGLSGGFGGWDWSLEPKFLSFNNRTTLQAVDWAFVKENSDFQTKIGSLDAGLSPIVSPNLPTWGIKLASKNALTPAKISDTPGYVIHGKIEQPGEVVLVINNEERQRINANDKYNFTDVTLTSKDIGDVRVISRSDEGPQTLKSKLTYISGNNFLLPKTSAWSTFAGISPPRFTPPQPSRDNPLLLPQSFKLLLGGRYYYGLGEKTTLGVSFANDSILGPAQSFFQNTFASPFVPLNGSTSYIRNFDFFQGQALGISLNRRLSEKVSLLSDFGISRYNLRSSAQNFLDDTALGKSGVINFEYDNGHLKSALSFFHYDTDYYSPSSTQNLTGLYDRRGIKLSVTGNSIKRPLTYQFNLTGNQSNLSDLVRGGRVNAVLVNGILSYNLNQNGRINLNFNRSAGSNNLNEFISQSLNLNYSKTFRNNWVYNLRLFNQSTNNITLPDPANPISTPIVLENEFVQKGLANSIQLPFLKKHTLELGTTHSNVLDFSYIKASLNIGRFQIEPLIQLSYNSLQINDRIGMRFNYTAKNGRKIGLGYFYNRFRFGFQEVDRQLQSTVRHEVTTNFTDLIGFVGHSLRFGGPNMTKQARLQLISFLDYNADGKRSEKEPLLPDIDLNIDYKPEGKTDKQGELMVSNLTLGKHRVAVNSNTLPLTLKVPDDMYINIKKPVLYKALVPIQATGSTASGKLSIKSVLPKDANSTTFPYIRLLLINKDKQVVQVTETMEDGYFYFGNLPPGEYYLDFEDKFKKSENFKIVKMPEPFKIEYSDDYKQINSVKALAIELLKLQ